MRGDEVMTEYRLDDLAEVSGISVRNIRNYRERGLIDPPRRAGRVALYDDLHVSQLKTVKLLLRKGFNFAHIAEFFEGMRNGADLAEMLGIQQEGFVMTTNDVGAIMLETRCERCGYLVHFQRGGEIICLPTQCEIMTGDDSDA